ncbi:MAG TPA: hypothetical protein VFV71_08020 [Burkholderiales bacterium]|nr:hypothetical protein [Burkholderiales bacterium]
MRLQLTDRVALIEWPEGSGAPWVEFSGQIYGPEDLLPFESRRTARDFILRQMQSTYGLPVYWPALAIEFVFPVSEERPGKQPA